MIQTRHSVFETNSSSTHSIIIAKNSLMEDFLNGKNFINLCNSEIVLEKDIESEKLKWEPFVREAVNNNFNFYNIKNKREITNNCSGYWDAEERTKQQMVADGLIVNENDINDTDDQHLLDEFIRIFLDKMFCTFEDMNKECEVSYDDHIFYENNKTGEKYRMLSVYGSDSLDFGNWPLRN